MRVDEEVLDAGVLEQLIDALDVAALGQPHALRPAAEVALELAAADLDLGAAGVVVDDHQRHEAVRGGAGNQLQLAGLEEAAEAVEEVVVVLVDEDLAGVVKRRWYIWASG